MANFLSRLWVNPFGKMSVFRLFELFLFIGWKNGHFQTKPSGKKAIFRLFELLVFVPQKCVFLFQNLVKDIFLAYIEQKKKVGKTAIFRPKPWANPFGKMSIFRLFDLLVFIPYKGVFFVLEYRKRHFPGLFCQE